MDYEQVDLAILGGGCAGLSLAKQLGLYNNWDKKTVIIEPRTHYLNDKSWCFWESLDLQLQQQLEPIIRHSWRQWRFSGEHFSTVHKANNRRYCFIAAEDFYQHALFEIRKHRYLDLRTGQSVVKTEDHPNGIVVTLDNGSILLASTVIDTRPTTYTDSGAARLWQIFYGMEIEAVDPVFDNQTVGLMEHLIGKSFATEFMYILPFSSNRALIELTYFSNKMFNPKQLAVNLNMSLAKCGVVGDFTILRQEQGCLPMGLHAIAKSGSDRYHYAGIASGAIRPSTGYAFIRIQQWARRCARLLSQAKSLRVIAPYSSKLAAAMDNVFLNVLHDDPALGAQLFQGMAEKVSGPALVRFLMDEATVRDYWQLIRALPAFRFLVYSFHLNHLLFAKQSEV